MEYLPKNSRVVTASVDGQNALKSVHDATITQMQKTAQSQLGKLLGSTLLSSFLVSFFKIPHPRIFNITSRKSVRLATAPITLAQGNQANQVHEDMLRLANRLHHDKETIHNLPELEGTLDLEQTQICDAIKQIRTSNGCLSIGNKISGPHDCPPSSQGVTVAQSSTMLPFLNTAPQVNSPNALYQFPELPPLPQCPLPRQVHPLQSAYGRRTNLSMSTTSPLLFFGATLLIKPFARCFTKRQNNQPIQVPEPARGKHSQPCKLG